MLIGIYKAEIRHQDKEVLDGVKELFNILNKMDKIMIDNKSYGILYENMSRALIECAMKKPRNVHPYITKCFRHFHAMYLPNTSGMIMGCN
jgi:hypothetical protein